MCHCLSSRLSAQLVGAWAHQRSWTFGVRFVMANQRAPLTLEGAKHNANCSIDYSMCWRRHRMASFHIFFSFETVQNINCVTRSMRKFSSEINSPKKIRFVGGNKTMLRFRPFHTIYSTFFDKKDTCKLTFDAIWCEVTAIAIDENYVHNIVSNVALTFNLNTKPMKKREEYQQMYISSHHIWAICWKMCSIATKWRKNLEIQH